MPGAPGIWATGGRSAAAGDPGVFDASSGWGASVAPDAPDPREASGAADTLGAAGVPVVPGASIASWRPCLPGPSVLAGVPAASDTPGAGDSSGALGVRGAPGVPDALDGSGAPGMPVCPGARGASVGPGVPGAPVGPGRVKPSVIGGMPSIWVCVGSSTDRACWAAPKTRSVPGASAEVVLFRSASRCARSAATGSGMPPGWACGATGTPGTGSASVFSGRFRDAVSSGGIGPLVADPASTPPVGRLPGATPWPGGVPGPSGAVFLCAEAGSADALFAGAAEPGVPSSGEPWPGAVPGSTSPCAPDRSAGRPTVFSAGEI